MQNKVLVIIDIQNDITTSILVLCSLSPNHVCKFRSCYKAHFMI